MTCSSSALGQFELDAAVAAVGVRVVARVQGLEFAEPGRGQTLRRHPFFDQERTTEIARAVDNCQFEGNSAVAIGRRSV